MLILDTNAVIYLQKGLRAVSSPLCFLRFLYFPNHPAPILRSTLNPPLRTRLLRLPA
ncbi:MAG: hypothetical protein CDV28_11029 [Candidatus Electronema aureum]|uniref:Uncharacterized protein n=1 Tax=Candidatus Electronema aureum TaxID=2005002 RepID=A0A521G2S2_9BACT|nr:MAG: hypothetical protein CDV28_11029 [Candidatus Electronema aureum]